MKLMEEQRSSSLVGGRSITRIDVCDLIGIREF